MSLPKPIFDRIERFARDLAGELENPDVFGPFVKQQVALLIESGELVPRERLQISSGLELGPAGLQQAARRVLHAAKDQSRSELEEALTALSCVLDPPTETQVSVEVEDQEADDEAELVCEVCGVEIDAEQALVSTTRWRKRLCKKHHASGGKDKDAAKRKDDSE